MFLFQSPKPGGQVCSLVCFSSKHRRPARRRLRKTCRDLLRGASHAAALIRGRRDDDAVVHAAAHVVESAGRGRAVAGDEGLVVTLGSHHVEGRVLRLLPLHQQRVPGALPHHGDGC